MSSPVIAAIERLRDAGANIVLGGHVDDRAEYRTVVAHASALIHGHSVGGINPALIEAMGSGALIFALDTPFNREALGDTGRLFESQDELQALLRTQSLGDHGGVALRQQASRRATTVFSLADVATAYESILHQASGAGRKRIAPTSGLWVEEDLLRPR